MVSSVTSRISASFFPQIVTLMILIACELAIQAKILAGKEGVKMKKAYIKLFGLVLSLVALAIAAGATTSFKP